MFLLAFLGCGSREAIRLDTGSSENSTTVHPIDCAAFRAREATNARALITNSRISFGRNHAILDRHSELCGEPAGPPESS